MNEKVMGVFNLQGSKGTGCASTEDTCPTLGHCNTSVDVHAVAIDQQGGKGAASFAEGVAPTMAADSHGTPRAGAVRTANTHANGHGVADEATHTLDRASGQAVCVGVDTYNQSISPNVMHTLHHHDGLDNQPKVCVEATGLTMTLDRFHHTGVEEVANTLRTSSAQGDNAPTICIDAYNQSATEESCMTLRSAMTGTDGNDADPKVVTNGVATMLKVRCGADTYIKPDGSVGTAGKGPLASEESAFTLAATQDQHLVLRHIVRRLTPTECERLMALPDNYTRIPYRGRPADQCPDSPRYKALGNSWATNCAEWILRRIVAAVRLGMIGGQE